jgi:hypothetical protein
VKNNLDALGCSCADGWIGQIAFEEFHGFKANKIRALAGEEVVDSAHGFSVLKQCGRDGPADEASGSGNKKLRHENSVRKDARRIAAAPS